MRKLSVLEVLPVDCNSVEIQSVFHNPLVELAVYRHPCHHQKTGQPHPCLLYTSDKAMADIISAVQCSLDI